MLWNGDHSFLPLPLALSGVKQWVWVWLGKHSCPSVKHLMHIIDTVISKYTRLASLNKTCQSKYFPKPGWCVFSADSNGCRLMDVRQHTRTPTFARLTGKSKFTWPINQRWCLGWQQMSCGWRKPLGPWVTSLGRVWPPGSVNPVACHSAFWPVTVHQSHGLLAGCFIHWHFSLVEG